MAKRVLGFKPLLAEHPDREKYPLRFPFWASPKFDGIRMIVRDGQALSRTLKPIPNAALSALFSDPRLSGLDGEIVAGPCNAADAMQTTMSAFSTHDAVADGVVFHVFDYVDDFERPTLSYLDRLSIAADKCAAIGPHVQLVQHFPVHTWEEAEAMMHAYIADGYEGLMLRDPAALYKFGRSTEKEQILIKLKPFEDAEGEVIGYYEREHNENEQTRDERGYAKRSTHKAGKTKAGMLGGVVVRLHGWPAEHFKLGNGWSEDERIAIWNEIMAGNEAVVMGKLAKYKFQREGSKEKPRIPVWLGWRHPDDAGSLP